METKFYLVMPCVLICFLVSVSFAETTFTVQAGAFKRAEQANTQANMLRSKGIDSVTVEHNLQAPGAFGYRVLVGEFDSRSEASQEQKKLKQAKIDSFIRTGNRYDLAKIDAAIKGELPPLLKVRNVEAVSTAKAKIPLEASLKIVRSRALNGPTSAPETLAAYKDFINSMPDNHHHKGREILTYARRSFSGHSAYDKKRPDYKDVKKMLKKVATKQVGTTAEQRRTASDLFVHVIHYYDQNYINAIRGYKQIIAETKENKRLLAITRTELAGAIFEVSKKSGYSTTKTQEALFDLWQKNVKLQEDYLTTDTKDAKAIRYATARIGLMLSESYIEQEQWEEMEGVAKSLISSYKDYEDCWGAVAEAWCHLTHAYAVQKQPEAVYHAGEQAIRVGREIGKPVWGDPRRDVVWKSYAWQRYAAIRAMDYEKQNQLEKEMKNQFPETWAEYMAEAKRDND